MDTDVLIAGGGPVGTALSIELARRGVSSIVLERRSTLHNIPKGQNLTQRTGEHFKAWGVSSEIREASVIPHEYGSAGVTAYGSLFSGYHFDWFKRASVAKFYAADNERLPQYATEQVLRRRASRFDCTEMRLGWTVRSVSLGEGEARIEAEAQSGARTQLTGSFLVGCDGSASTVRGCAGIAQDHGDRKRRMVLIVFHIVQPKLDGYWQFLGRVDLQGTWFYHSPVPPDSEIDELDIESHLQGAIGAAFDIEALHVGFWDLRFSVARKFRRGRVFVAGDAAHSHPPYGGYGINLGFEDARNLGWKLAAKIQGWGGEALLETYEQERRG